MLASKDVVADTVTRLRASDFASPHHRMIYTAIIAVYASGQPVHPEALIARLTAEGQPADRVASYISALTADAPTAPSFTQDARLVADLATRRALKAAAQKITMMADDPRGLPISDIADMAQHWIFEATTVASSIDSPSSLLDLMGPAVDYVDAAYEARGARLGTGLTDLDGLLNGLSPGELIVIGGRAGMGKTAVALTIARNASLRLGYSSVIFSNETKKIELTLRVVSAESGVPLHTLRSGMLSDSDWTALAATMTEIHEGPLYLDDRAYDFREIRAKTRRLRMQHNISLVVVDCIQGFARGGPDRYGEVSAIAHGLKALAMECDVPVIAVSQLNRTPEGRTDKRPELAHLRDGGTIEDYADVVILVHRDDYYDAGSPRAGECDLIVCKHRNGPTSTVVVSSQLHLARVSDPADAAGSSTA